DYDLSSRSIAMHHRRQNRQRVIVKAAAPQRRLIVIKKYIVSRPYLVNAIEMIDVIYRGRRAYTDGRDFDAQAVQFGRMFDHYIAFVACDSLYLLDGPNVVRMPGVCEDPGKIKVCGIGELSRNVDSF